MSHITETIFFQIQLFAVVHCAFDSFWRKMDPFLSINFLLDIIYTFIIFCCWEKTLIVSKLASFSLFFPGSPSLKQILKHTGEECLWDPQFQKEYNKAKNIWKILYSVYAESGTYFFPKFSQHLTWSWIIIHWALFHTSSY